MKIVKDKRCHTSLWQVAILNLKFVSTDKILLVLQDEEVKIN